MAGQPGKMNGAPPSDYRFAVGPGGVSGQFGGISFDSSRLLGAPPPPPDYMGLANQQAQMGQGAVDQQTAQNRINQSNPYASLTYGPDGSQQMAFTGPMAGLNSSLQQQAAQSMSSPLSFGGLPGLANGAAAREQAIDAAYGSATSRLDPAFSQREEALRSRLLNQGLQPGSAAYEREMSQLGRDRNDAYGQALSSAIGQGTAAGQALFQQSLAGREQAMEELLRTRSQPMQELGMMQGLTGMAGYNTAGRADTPNLLGAAGMQHAANFGNYNAQQQQLVDLIGGGAQLAGSLGALLPFLLSDERAKTDVQRLETEVVPGVPAAIFRYRPEHGLGTGLHVGVVAQDLARVMPGAVRERPDGLLEVHPDFAPLLVEE